MLNYSLYLVTDDPSRYSRNWLDQVVAAVEGGVSCVQYRDTESDSQAQYRRILALKDAIGSVPVVVNNDAELARAVKADGVHVGQSDMPPEQVRGIVGNACEIGLSITDISQVTALRRKRRFVDAIGIGPVYDATKTKADASSALGLERLREIVEVTADFRNCAIGGITLERAPAVLAAGAQGLAIVSALSQAADPYATAKSFRRLFS